MPEDHQQDIISRLKQLYPNIEQPHVVLEKLNALLGIFKPHNGGNVETHIRWAQCEAQWDDVNVTFRDSMRDTTRKK